MFLLEIVLDFGYDFLSLDQLPFLFLLQMVPYYEKMLHFHELHLFSVPYLVLFHCLVLVVAYLCPYP